MIVNEGNIVDEHRILDDLEAASDYKRGIVGNWMEKEGCCEKKLRELADD